MRGFANKTHPSVRQIFACLRVHKGTRQLPHRHQALGVVLRPKLRPWPRPSPHNNCGRQQALGAALRTAMLLLLALQPRALPLQRRVSLWPCLGVKACPVRAGDRPTHPDHYHHRHWLSSAPSAPSASGSVDIHGTRGRGGGRRTSRSNRRLKAKGTEHVRHCGEPLGQSGTSALGVTPGQLAGLRLGTLDMAHRKAPHRQHHGHGKSRGVWFAGDGLGACSPPAGSTSLGSAAQGGRDDGTVAYWDDRNDKDDKMGREDCDRNGTTLPARSAVLPSPRSVTAMASSRTATTPCQATAAVSLPRVQTALPYMRLTQPSRGLLLPRPKTRAKLNSANAATYQQLSMVGQLLAAAAAAPQQSPGVPYHQQKSSSHAWVVLCFGNATKDGVTEGATGRASGSHPASTCAECCPVCNPGRASQQQATSSTTIRFHATFHGPTKAATRTAGHSHRLPPSNRIGGLSHLFVQGAHITQRQGLTSWRWLHYFYRKVHVLMPARHWPHGDASTRMVRG
eukprot:m.344480 g.344480  ORF g.344480 m.344480 type:complete len:510 (+) comp19854_c2_seq17:2591-4120(+)